MVHDTTIIRKTVEGNRKVRYAMIDITDYDAPEDLTPGEFHLRTIEDVIPISFDNYYIGSYDPDSLELTVTNPTAQHAHVSMIIEATAAAVSDDDMVPLQDGTGTPVANTRIGHAGGAGADIDVTSSTNTGSGGSEVPGTTNVGEVRLKVIGW